VAINCPKCRAENPDALKFCGECGTRLVPPESPQASQPQTFDTSTLELSRGTILAGRYEVLDELDSGGMGKVYRVLDRKLGEEVALKLIRPEIATRKLEEAERELLAVEKIQIS